jgi:hypothetical protein
MNAIRQNILTRLEHLSELLPEMRLSQLMCNLVTLVPEETTLWDMEDEQLLEAIKQLEESLSSKLVGVS